jgi:5'-methylthioadenosine phosphorylase
MNPPFCPSVSSFITKGAKSVGWNRVISGGVYICMEGPRLETPAEVRMLRLLRGDIVGMPIATEAILFRELELCYGALCFVVNKAEGLLPFVNTPSSDGLVPPDERSIEERMRKILGKILIVVSSRLRISDDKKCICLRAQEEAKLDGILSDSWEKWFSDTNI